ncbi:MAG: hypothetical protein JWM21_3169 [Acidobacteria bacterium]|nr:hypothetical protein [Acidobacteriota bacterium]
MSGFLKAIVIVLIVGVLGSIFVLSYGSLTPKETGLLSIILFICSILGTWVVSHIYGESSSKRAIQDVKEFHQANLRMYALKAAEKVNNLSNELNLLSVYLQQELDSTDYETTEEKLLAKEERMESAIHIIKTLKSINDTGLSDWEGVIGDELSQQREEREEREEDLRDIIERLQMLWATDRAERESKHDDTGALKSDIESIRKELRLLVTDVVGTSIRLPRISKKPRKEEVEKPCPSCSQSVKFRQRTNPRSIKAVKCASCQTQLISRYNKDAGFQLEIRGAIPAEIKCPWCDVELRVHLDAFPGSSVRIKCDTCNETIRVVRTPDDDVRVTSIPPPQPDETKPTQEILKLVQERMPPQPWPKDASKQVAEQIGVSNHMITKAIAELIRRGVFQPQIDGKLYVPLPLDGSPKNN